MSYYYSSKYLFIGTLIVALLLCPYIILGEDAFITIHDFLDSNPVHVQSVISMDLVGKYNGMLPVLEGVSSLSYISLIPLDIKTILYLFLPLYWAIVVNIFFVKIVAFWGMYLLCNRYLLKNNCLYSMLIGVIFSLVPFYSDYGLSSAGIPLFLYSVFNLERKENLLQSYILIVFFTCNSSLALVGLFICFLWGCWVAFKFYEDKDLAKKHLIGLMLMLVVYIFQNISVLSNFIMPTGIVSHRVEFEHLPSVMDDIIAVKTLLFVNSQYHAGSFSTSLVLLVSLFLLEMYGRKDKTRMYCYIAFVSLAVLITVGTLIKHLPLQAFSSFQFDRFYFFYPALCFIILAKAFSYISHKRLLAIVLGVLVALSNVSFDSDLLSNVHAAINNKALKSPSFKQFLDQELFKSIKEDLGISKPFSTKVVSLGMYPSVAEYNQFYTLDSYVFSYPLEYKHKFRKVIEGELSKDESMRCYFDKWGSRCYIFCSELWYNNSYLCSKREDISIKHLDIDTEVLKNLGCQYVLSAVNIENYKDIGLSFVNSYTTPNSYWNIRVYKID